MKSFHIEVKISEAAGALRLRCKLDGIQIENQEEKNNGAVHICLLISKFWSVLLCLSISLNT